MILDKQRCWCILSQHSIFLYIIDKDFNFAPNVIYKQSTVSLWQKIPMTVSASDIAVCDQQAAP